MSIDIPAHFAAVAERLPDAGGWIPPEGKSHWYASGCLTAQDLIARGIIANDSEVLDLGCGNGRLAAGLAHTDVEYLGIDCDPTMIDFCKRTFAPFRRFRFECNYVHNPYYTAENRVSPVQAPFPRDELSIDTVIANSFFTHVETLAIAYYYLDQVHRVLRRGRQFFSTWFRSPPNDPCGDAARTALPESSIIRILAERFVITDTWGGFTAEHADQWRIVAHKA